MIDPKVKIYEILTGLPDVHVYQERPDIIKQFPSITFRISDNTPEYTIDKGIGLQNVDVVIDIFAKDSTQTSSLLTLVEAEMRENDYRLIFCQDLIEDDVSHIATIFNISI